jgi:molybdenum cofactor biosynthesis enzyme MoaA
VFRAMGVPLARVLEGIAAAHEAGLWPVKLNTVVERGVNGHGLVELARFARANGLIVRFEYFEYMDVGTTTAGAWTTSSPPPRSFAASTPSCPVGAARRAEQTHPAPVGLPAWIVPVLAPHDAP